MSDAVKWINDNAGVVAILGALVAAAGAIVVWIVYRRGARDQRAGVLDALRTELELHRL
jgi:hypothetical protein